MAETVYTLDGKLHTLLGSCTIGEIVREYAGEDAARLVEELAGQNARAEADVETDLLSYERDLDHWHRMAQDWAGELGRCTSAPASYLRPRWRWPPAQRRLRLR